MINRDVKIANQQSKEHDKYLEQYKKARVKHFKKIKKADPLYPKPVHHLEPCPDCYSDKNGWSTHCKTCGLPIVY
jgi:hypothetical protein